MTPVAAVTVLSCRDAVLLIRRPQRLDDPWSGQWALPGGRRDPADADLLATARRELAEEVGVVLDDTGWTPLAVQVAGLHRGLGVPVAPFQRTLTEPPTLHPEPREVAETRWLSLAELRDPARHAHGPVPGGGERPWPFFALDGTPLWGFTYRVLTTWLGMTTG